MALKAKIFNHSCDCKKIEDDMNEFLSDGEEPKEIIAMTCSDIRGGIHVVIIYKE